MGNTSGKRWKGWCRRIVPNKIIELMIMKGKKNSLNAGKIQVFMIYGVKISKLERSGFY